MYLRIHLPVSAAHTAAVLSADPVPRQGEFTFDTSTSQIPSLLKVKILNHFKDAEINALGDYSNYTVAFSHN